MPTRRVTTSRTPTHSGAWVYPRRLTLAAIQETQIRLTVERQAEWHGEDLNLVVQAPGRGHKQTTPDLTDASTLGLTVP